MNYSKSSLKKIKSLLWLFLCTLNVSMLSLGHADELAQRRSGTDSFLNFVDSIANREGHMVMATKHPTQDTRGIDTNAQIIDKAINGKKKIDFLYHGYHRIGEPHILGIMNGAYTMLLYQTDGASSSGELGWRLFKLKDIKMLSVLKDTFKGARHVDGPHLLWEKQISVVEQE